MEKRAEALGPTGERVSQRLRLLRRARGLTLRQLEDKLQGLGRPILLSSLSKIEKGQRRVDVDDLVALALALEVSPNYILLSDDYSQDLEVQLAPTFSLDAASAWEWAARPNPVQSAEARPVDVAATHHFARQLRGQVAALHGHMRLPHLGVSRSVPYSHLYIEPVLHPEQEQQGPLDPRTLALPGRRSVILGHPGSGKSTLLAKLAHDVASDLVPGAEERVPFLLVLRQFAESYRAGGKGLVHYLEQICGAPYNLEPPPQAVDYLLRNGRAVVLLDGLDELVEPELRRTVVQLIDGFISHYQQVPVVVSARQVGYSDVPLDRRLFTVSVIADREVDQVRRYVERWFALDESIAESDRARMATSFLTESNGIAELRSNPLILGLLCAMYSSEQYIPRNLAQVYEQCAVMLFDRWDSVRGIAMPVRFQGHLRGAVQYIAWQLLDSDQSGQARPRHKIVQMLAGYLATKGFDEDDAMATAERFVEFCTGRAWILTDVGTTETEPLYGFTHRVFLEYFAAEYLVRTNPTADQLWHALRPRVLSGEREIVSKIALQLLDRNVDGGADEFLRLALAEKQDDLHAHERPGLDGDSEDIPGADVELHGRLRAVGFSGPAWNYVAAELARYGWSVMSAWLSTGVIAQKSQEKGRNISLPDDWTVDDREDLVAATVADGLQLFRQALVDNRWNPENRMSLRTYFLGGCIRAFPNVLRRWGNDRQRYRQAVIASAREATVHWQAVEPIDIVDAVDALRSLTRDEDQRSREITHLHFDNYNPAEIARVLDIAPEKVRATLRRLRRRALDDRESGSLTD